MVIPIGFIAAGMIFILFNRKLVEIETKIKSRKGKTVNERLLKTQFYVAGGLFLLTGIIVLAIDFKSIFK